MNRYEDYYLLQDVKYYMFESMEVFSKCIEDGEMLSDSNFGIYHLKKLIEIMDTNDKHLMIYPEMKEHLFEFLSFLFNNIKFENPMNKKEYYQLIIKAQTKLMQVKTSDREEFYKKEFIKRMGVFEDSNNFFNKNEEVCIEHLISSLKFDETFVCYLNPNMVLSIKEQEILIDQFFIWSLNSFYEENRDLFLNPKVGKNIRKNLFYLINPTEDKKELFDSETLNTIVNNSKNLLKKLG